MAEFGTNRTSQRQIVDTNKQVEQLKVVAQPVQIREEKGVDLSKLQTLQKALNVGATLSTEMIRKTERDNNDLALKKLYEAENNGEDLRKPEVLDRISKESGIFINTDLLEQNRDKLVGNKISTDVIDEMSKIRDTFNDDENIQKETDIETFFYNQYNILEKKLKDELLDTNPIIIKQALDNLKKAKENEYNRVIKPEAEKRLKDQIDSDTKYTVNNVLTRNPLSKDFSKSVEESIKMLKYNYGGNYTDYTKTLVSYGVTRAVETGDIEYINELKKISIDGVNLGSKYYKEFQAGELSFKNKKTETDYRKQAEFEHKNYTEDRVKELGIDGIEKLAQQEDIKMTKDSYMKMLKIEDTIENKKIADERLSQFNGSYTQAISLTTDNEQKQYLIQKKNENINSTLTEYYNNPNDVNLSKHIQNLKMNNEGKVDTPTKNAINQVNYLTEQDILNMDDNKIQTIQDRYSLARTLENNGVEVYSSEEKDMVNVLHLINDSNPNNNFKDNLLLYSRAKTINYKEHIKDIESNKEIKSKLSEIKDINIRLKTQKSLAILSGLGMEVNPNIVDSLISKRNLISIDIDTSLFSDSIDKEFPSFINNDNYSNFKETLSKNELVSGDFELIPNEITKTFMIAKRNENGELDTFNPQFISYKELQKIHNDELLKKVTTDNKFNSEIYQKKESERTIKLFIDRNKIMIDRFKDIPDYKDFVNELKNKNKKLQNKLKGSISDLTSEQLKFVEEDIIK